MNRTISVISSFKATIEVPGDKSISHRALLLGALATGKSRIKGLSGGMDIKCTMQCLEHLGGNFRNDDGEIFIRGRGLRDLLKPNCELYCGNSGTTMRLLMGILAAQNFDTTLTGDEPLSRRPMSRVSIPLSKMGANILLSKGDFSPIKIEGNSLHGMHHQLRIPSAQVKGAIILAGLYADGETVLTGRIDSRDHTERMLSHFGARIESGSERIKVKGHNKLQPIEINVPGDISSAAYWLTAACIIPRSEVEFYQIGLNPTRMGFLRVLERMGAFVEKEITQHDPEPCGILCAGHRSLCGVEIGADEIPYLIDEIPLIAVLGLFAEGKTCVRGAGELRFKESNRIDSMAINLKRMGANIEVFEDGFEIYGPQKLHGASVDSMGDHRIAMALSILALAIGNSEVQNAECVEKSYPGFYNILEKIAHE